MNAGERANAPETERWRRAAAPNRPMERTEADGPGPLPSGGDPSSTDPGLGAEAPFPSTVEPTPPTGSTIDDPPRLDFELIASLSQPRRALPEIPGFLVLEELGAGGMGVVYKARSLRLNRTCALKMIRAGRHADGRATLRFLGEAEAIAKLKHPNVVQIYSIGEAEGLPYLELEYLEGGSLASKLDGAPWSARRAAELVRALAQGLSAAHGSGLIHRDMKPGNVLLAEDGSPKVADFGLAKAWEADSYLTSTGSIVGTPSYMAPEQAEGGGSEVNPAVDIYGLGAILFELLTGRPPFRGATLLETLEQVRWADPIRPSRLVPGLPRDIETICLKCLRKRPRDRYACAEDLGEDLRRFLAREPIRARPVSSLERGFKWARRRPGAAALLASLVVALIGLTGLGAWSYWRISLELAKTKRAESAAVAEAYGALRSEVRALRLGHPPGWREHALGDLGRMAAMDTPARSLTDLRSEAVACLGEIDVREVARLDVGGDLRSIDYSPDGKLMVTAHYDGRLRLWDPIGFKHLRVLDDPKIVHANRYSVEAPMPSVRFRPGDDRGVLAFSTWGDAVSWLDPRRPEAGPEIPGRGQATSIAFDGRGELMAIGWTGGWVSLHEGETGRTIRVIELAGITWQTPVALSPDGEWLATSGEGRSVRLHRISEPGSPAIVLGRHADDLRTLTFSPDGKTLASASMDNNAKLWDLEKFEERLTLRGHTAALNGIDFHPSGAVVATAGDDETVRIWDVRTGQELVAINPGVGTVLAVGFSEDGSQLACGHDGICFYSVDGVRERQHLRGHSFYVPDVAFHPSLPLVISGSAELRVHVWDPETGRPLGLLEGGSGDRVALACIAVSPKSRAVALGPDTFHNATGLDFRVRLWDLGVGPPGRLFEGHSTVVTALAFDGDGSRLASGATDGRLIVWDMATGRILWDGRSEGGAVVSVAFSRDGRNLIASGSGGEIGLHDLGGGWPSARSRVEAGAARSALAPDGTRLYIGCNDGDLRILGLPGLEERAHLEKAHGGQIRGIAVASDGSLLATGGDDHRIVVRDPETLEELFSVPSLDGAVHRLAFSHRGLQLAIAGVEKRVTVWNLSAIHPKLEVLGLSWQGRASALPTPTQPRAEGEIFRGKGPLSPVDRAWLLMGDGENLRGRGQFEEAIVPHLRALDSWEEILGQHADDPFYRSERGVTLAALADVYVRAGRREEGIRSLRLAMEAIEPLRDDDPRISFNAARVLALAGAIEGDPGLAEQAVRRLRRSLAAGYKDFHMLKQSVDLASLQGRPDFRALLAGAANTKGWPRTLARTLVPGRFGDPDAVVSEARLALSLLGPLVAADPADPWIRRQEALARVGLAAILHQAGLPMEEAGDWAGAVEVLAGQDHLKAAESVALARGHALLYGMEREESRAVRALDALRTGLGTDLRPFLLPAISGRAFDPLRDRPEFRAFATDSSPSDASVLPTDRTAH